MCVFRNDCVVSDYSPGIAQIKKIERSNYERSN